MAEFQLPEQKTETQETAYEREQGEGSPEQSEEGAGQEEEEEEEEEEEGDEEGEELASDAGAFQNVAQGLAGRHKNMLMQYWQDTINSIENDDHDFKNHHLPLARIKKVMKTDEEVRMISAEAPILFAKGCDVFITELTMRAWIHAEENKRRTLQRSDIAAALQKSDMFDFLIDIVPREEEKKRNTSSRASMSQQSQPQSNSLYQHHFLQQYQKHANPSEEGENEDQHSIANQESHRDTPPQSSATNEEGTAMGFMM